MYIMFAIAIVFMFVGVVLLDNDNPLGGGVFAISFFVIILFVFLNISFLVELPKMREKVKNPQFFTARELAEFNNRVADIKSRPLWYLGYDLRGIDYVDLDSAGAMKMDFDKTYEKEDGEK